MNKKSVLVGVGVVLAVVLSIFSLTKSPTERVVERVIEKQFGSLPGTDLNGPEFCVNGVCTLNYSKGMTTATSTVCVIPVVATSTLRTFRAIITGATSTNAMLVLATSTIGYAPPIGQATSSLYAWATIAANTGGTARGAGFYVTNPYTVGPVTNGFAATNASSTAEQNLLRAGEYLVLYARGGGVSNDTQTGTVFSGKCSTVFEKF